MLNLKTLVLGATLAAASVGAFAAGPDATRGIDRRQEEQAARIDQALHSGRLAPRDARALAREQRDIRRYEARAKADGVVTRSERRELQAMLDRASRHIRYEARR